MNITQLRTIFFNANGRINRMQYFGYSMLLILLAILLAMVFGLIMTLGDVATIISILPIVVTLVGFVYASIVLTIKRLHDLNLSGLNVIWIWCINLLSGVTDTTVGNIFSIIGLGVSLWLVFAPGTKGENTYGNQPE